MEEITCGIEIHQQLEGKKLFCKCKTELIDTEPHYTVQRELRAVAGEAGAIDVAAAQAAGKGKKYSYEGYADNGCLVELDETPPYPVNEESMQTALQVSKLLNANVVDNCRVMRKIVIDGSNTSGFQRTMLISRNGKLKTASGEVGIPTIGLEEDSCRIISEDNNTIVYRLDRLGIPLLEIGTSPDIHSPEQCKEVAEAIGMILRSTGKVKRGLGTIRQDVNVSIPGGNRVEIKGAQDLKMLPKLVEIEAKRQKTLLEIKEALAKRRVKEFTGKPINLTNVLKGSASKLVEKTLKEGGVIKGALLPGFEGLIGKETQPGKRLGTEFSERAKVIAGVGGIIHSDELPNYGITDHDVEIISKTLGCKEGDGFFFVATSAEKAEKAVEAVIQRANEALHEVPKEVRKPNEDGTTSYLRPMPGASRMYPETDIPSIPLGAKAIGKIELPELIEDKVKKYEKLGMSKDLAELAGKSEQAEQFENAVKKYKNLKPAYIAEVLFGSVKAIKRQINIKLNPTTEDFSAIFNALNEGTISKESILEILKENKPVASIIGKYRVLSQKELDAELKKIIAENKNTEPNALIGKAMAKLRGKASGQVIVERLNILTKNV